MASGNEGAADPQRKWVAGEVSRAHPSRVHELSCLSLGGVLAPVSCLSQGSFLPLCLCARCMLVSGLYPCGGCHLLPALPMDQQASLAHCLASLHLHCRSGSVAALWKHTLAPTWATSSLSKLPTRAARPWPTVSELQKCGWMSLKNSTTTAIRRPAW